MRKEVERDQGEQIEACEDLDVGEQKETKVKNNA